MSVRVVARIRPLVKSELEKDVIVTTGQSAAAVAESKEGKQKKDAQPTVVRIPNPKNPGENFSFQFNSVYGQIATQQELFDAEVAPTVKHLFNGFDVTLFAYGVTGTGKTHTMRGGKSLADRGAIPRLLSAIFRRSRKIEKDSQGATSVQVAMSYYEIYNDRVFDLFEPPEKRTPTGLQLRDNNGKTVVVGLTERPCTTLKDFESLYDQANVNRSTSATKLNAHSSRSHAILCVKLTVSNATMTRVSTASAIDLAGSEDNRRTDNNRERLVESASINKSLFVLAQCVEAISKKQHRIPYRESKMTRILSLGQNNGLTVMILNLAPVRSYHLDTLSSLNFANRTKKIEVKEVENEPLFKSMPKAAAMSTSGTSFQRQPLRPLATVHNTLSNNNDPAKSGKPAKAFAVFSDASEPHKPSARAALQPKVLEPRKRGSDALSSSNARPLKTARKNDSSKLVVMRDENENGNENKMSKQNIEAMIEKKVTEILASRALSDASHPPAPEINEQVQKRLAMLEQRVEDKENEGLNFLLMAKQHHVRGEDTSALKMYQLALPHFPNNEKLINKMLGLEEKLRLKREEEERARALPRSSMDGHTKNKLANKPFYDHNDLADEDYEDQPSTISAADSDWVYRPEEDYDSSFCDGLDRPRPRRSRQKGRNAGKSSANAKSKLKPMDKDVVAKQLEALKRGDLESLRRAGAGTAAATSSTSSLSGASLSSSSFSSSSSALQSSSLYQTHPSTTTNTSFSTSASNTRSRSNSATFATSSSADPSGLGRSSSSSGSAGPHTPRTQHLLRIINTRDVNKIKLLKGVGTKRAQVILNSLSSAMVNEDDEIVNGLLAGGAGLDVGSVGVGAGAGGGRGGAVGDERAVGGARTRVRNLDELAGLKGVGAKTVQNMRLGLAL
ncbi:kinesin-domain-containing protein [Xylona heveae TC161]|uniref:Kinesin-domain-containing protein n=1 Tax=Xylona heveae (strain CBS 132557 / TC161) TaxID=1328760 RepID=A0A165G976_XYLHT|nr:kinesin-domain-containing protein [Xylona heveae TC161]KZF21898.1 kinesin-domain-containing protein [Xylona heveae TC161]